MSVSIRFINSNKCELTLQKAQSHFLSFKVLILNVIMSIFMCALDFYIIPEVANLFTRLMAWFMTFWMIFVGYFLVFAFTQWLSDKFRPVELWTIIAHVILAFWVSFFVYLLQRHTDILGGLITTHFSSNLGVIFGVVLLLELVVIAFFLHNSELDRQIYPEPKTNSPSSITLGGIKFNVKDLILVKSEDHYCLVVTKRGETYCRARIAEVIEQVDETIGVSVHQRYWVALREIKSIETSTENARVVLKNGIEVPISRGRRAFVKSELSHFIAGRLI